MQHKKVLLPGLKTAVPETTRMNAFMCVGLAAQEPTQVDFAYIRAAKQLTHGLFAQIGLKYRPSKLCQASRLSALRMTWQCALPNSPNYETTPVTQWIP